MFGAHRHGRFIRLLGRFWLGSAVIITTIVASFGGLYAYYYCDEAIGPRVVSLMYHRFTSSALYAQCQGDDRYYAIASDKFEEQLAYLAQNGYRSIRTDECVDFLHGKRTVPERSVMLTIDDGYVSTLTLAQPLLKKYGFSATLFVTADSSAHVFREGTPRQRRLSDEELRKLDPAVIEIAAHGLTHRALTRLGDSELHRELVDSRRQLERVTGRRIRTMAIPGNAYDERVLRAARKAGYDCVFTSDPGSLDEGDDTIGLPRVNVAGYFGADGLASILDPASMATRRFVRTATFLPCWVFGERIGEWLRRPLAALVAVRPPSRGYWYVTAQVLALAWLGPLWNWRTALRLKAAHQPCTSPAEGGIRIAGPAVPKNER